MITVNMKTQEGMGILPPLASFFSMGDIATASEFTAALLIAVIGSMNTEKGCMATTLLLQSGIWHLRFKD